MFILSKSWAPTGAISAKTTCLWPRPAESWATDTSLAKCVIDGTGHDSEMCRTVARKNGIRLAIDTGDVIGERSLDVVSGEEEVVNGTKEIYPGLYVCGMAASAVSGTPRMGPIFGGMLLSGHEREKIIVHDFPQLYYEFSLKGIHVNRNIHALPDGYDGFRTRSCHSLEEVQRFKTEYDYLFLSPIFNSISKAGYNAGFSGEELQKASDEGVIDGKVVALGGVTFESLPYLEKLNFGGAAMLGALHK